MEHDDMWKKSPRLLAEVVVIVRNAHKDDVEKTLTVRLRRGFKSWAFHLAPA